MNEREVCAENFLKKRFEQFVVIFLALFWRPFLHIVDFFVSLSLELDGFPPMMRCGYVHAKFKSLIHLSRVCLL